MLVVVVDDDDDDDVDIDIDEDVVNGRVRAVVCSILLLRLLAWMRALSFR